MKLCYSRKNILCAWADLEYSLTTSFPARTHHRLRQCFFFFFFFFWQKLKHAALDFVIGIMGVTTIFSSYLTLVKYEHQTLLGLSPRTPQQPSFKVPCCVQKEPVWNWEEQVSVRNQLKVTVCTSLISKLCSRNAEEMIIVFIAAGGLLTSPQFKTHAYFIASSDVFVTNWQVCQDPRSIIRATSQDRNPTETNVLRHSFSRHGGSPTVKTQIRINKKTTTSQTKYYI